MHYYFLNPLKICIKNIDKYYSNFINILRFTAEVIVM